MKPTHKKQKLTISNIVGVITVAILMTTLIQNNLFLKESNTLERKRFAIQLVEQHNEHIKDFKGQIFDYFGIIGKNSPKMSQKLAKKLIRKNKPLNLELAELFNYLETISVAYYYEIADQDILDKELMAYVETHFNYFENYMIALDSVDGYKQWPVVRELIGSDGKRE